MISRLRLASIAFALCCLPIACGNAQTKDDNPDIGKAGMEATGAGTAGTGGRNSGASGAPNGGETIGHAGTTGQAGTASGKGVVRLNLRAK